MDKMKWAILGFAAMLAMPAAHAFREAGVRSLQEVMSIWVDADVCPAGISKELQQHGFEVMPTQRHANATLEVNVITNGRYANVDSVERGRYVASLIGHDGEVLFRTAGEKTDHDLDNLCEEVGNDISITLESAIKS